LFAAVIINRQHPAQNAEHFWVYPEFKAISGRNSFKNFLAGEDNERNPYIRALVEKYIMTNTWINFNF